MYQPAITEVCKTVGTKGLDMVTTSKDLVLAVTGSVEEVRAGKNIDDI